MCVTGYVEMCKGFEEWKEGLRVEGCLMGVEGMVVGNLQHMLLPFEISPYRQGCILGFCEFENPSVYVLRSTT